MGRESPPPDQAASRERFHARTEPDQAARRSPWLPFWWIVATLLFVTGLIFCGYAFEAHRAQLWLGAITAFAIVGTMVSRAMTDADRERFKRAWQEYLERQRHYPGT
jgi:hypothetical protein